MGNTVNTVSHGIATAGTAVAAGVTFGQVDALNKAVVSEAKKTAECAKKSEVRYIGETVGLAVAANATQTAKIVTLGKIDALNKADDVVKKRLEKSSKHTVKAVSDVADGIPGVGHVKGSVHYILGDKEAGDNAMKSASRTTAVIGGAAFGGPAGAIAAGAAMDGITTGIDSAVHKEYRPAGLIAGGTHLAKGGNVVEGVGGIAVILAGDVYTGAAYRPKAKPTGKTARMNAKAKHQGKKGLYKVKKALGKEGEMPNPVRNVGAGKKPLPKRKVFKQANKDLVDPTGWVGPKIVLQQEVNAWKEKPEERKK